MSIMKIHIRACLKSPSAALWLRDKILTYFACMLRFCRSPCLASGLFKHALGGFTLLEILIALAILAISLTSLYVAQGNSLLMSGTADRYTVAAFLAEEQMTEWTLLLEDEIAHNQFPDDKDEQGEFEPPYTDYRFERSVRKIEIPLLLPESEDGSEQAIFKMMKTVLDDISKSAREVRVRVYWGETEEEQEEFVLTSHIVKLK